MDNQDNYNDRLLKLKKILVNYTDLDIEEITIDSKLMLDLGLTSFDFVCLSASIEEDLGIQMEIDQMTDVETVKDIYQYLEKMEMSI